jgi:protein O-mannosyl-transferase
MRARKLNAILALTLPLLGWWVYRNGLSGTFLFDDFNNLQHLGDFGRIDSLQKLLLYLSSGNADPIGRPLALLSFLIDADNWPASPESFKRTGVLLHLLNGMLLAWTLLKLGRRLRLAEGRAELAALLGAALWTLHPLLVSTTLYVVQREAMLPATFTLIGALLWIEGGDRCLEGRPGALRYLLGGAWGCAILATLCKANGILLPLLLLVTEYTIPARAAADNAADSQKLRRASLLLLGLPSIALGLWLLCKLPGAFTGATYGRPWTLAQRLLTEPRVLCDYLALLWIPRASGSSLFNDAFSASTDALHPWTTLPSIALILALIVAGFALRRRRPALAFALLFYFAGQLLESTVIPLELYFEHRNYLSALPMFWPLALWLTGDGPLRTVRLALALLLPLILAALCHTRVGVWGRPYQQAVLTADIDATSPRAQANAAAYETAHGRPELAIIRLAAATGRMPDEAQLAVNLIDAECAAGGVEPVAIRRTAYALEHNREQAELVQNWLVKAIGLTGRGACRGLNAQTMERLIEAVRRNPHYSKAGGHVHDVEQLEGRLALARGDSATALQHFNAGLAAFATPDGALQQAALLGSAGFPELGLQHLEYYKTLKPADRGLRGMAAVHLWLLDRQGFWTEEFTRMEQLLRDDAVAGKQKTPAGPSQQ